MIRSDHLGFRKVSIRRLLASAAALALAAPVTAFAANTAPSAEDPAVGDIIVTARRVDERLQDVPESVQAVSGDRLQKLAITSTEEISKVSPGLSLRNDGASTKIVLRGVAWQPGSGTPATPIYLNEVPFDPGNTIVSLFDVGQIEVLRGPQGTSRGAPSISGAVTITMKKPNLTEFGGYVQGLYGSGNHWDMQAGVNLPIVKDVLAIRLATNIENSEGNRVYSVHSTIKPKFDDRSFRATVLLKPTDTLSFQAMYQRRTTDFVQYDQVVGTGAPAYAGSPVAFLGALGPVPANFNGPAITQEQRLSVEDGGNTAHQQFDLLTINASWEIVGHKLSYNFGRQYNRSGASFNAQDPLNILPGFEPYTSPANDGIPAWHTHELRWSSMPSDTRPFDYDIGWFSKHSQGNQIFTAPSYQGGAFGGPTTLPGVVTVPNPAYVINSSTGIAIGQVFDSFYGDVKFHIDRNTELSGGLAIVRDRVPVGLNINVGGGLTNVGPLAVVKLAFPSQFQPLVTSCPVFGAFASGRNPGSVVAIPSATYPGTCDVVTAVGSKNSTQSNNDTYTAALYNFSLSHKFSDEVMVYATTGSSFRSGLPAINNPGLPTNLTTPKPETAKSYEVGVKTTWGRVFHINAAVFQLDYKNQLTTFQGVSYFNTVTGKSAATSLAFYSNVDSRVRGFEVEVGAQPTPELSLGANLSYSQIKSKGGNVPCNVGPAITAANPINFCASPVGQVLNQNAPFQASANGSYTVPFGSSLEGYLRFNLSYQGNNPNYGNRDTATNTFKATPAYAILDLFAGVVGQKGVWELGLFAKNVFDKQVELFRPVTPINIYSTYAAIPAGYTQVNVSRPRELGVSLRYAFGSR